MRRMSEVGIIRFAGFLGVTMLALACGNKQGEGTTGAPDSKPTTAATDTAATTTTATAATSAATATPPPSAVPSVTATASASASVAPATSGSAAAGAKTYDCGAKGQKPCPMQGWMKSTMGNAAASGDGDKLAQALTYVAGRSPPGFGNWSSIASGGAAKAKAGDIDGAKASCKQCHDAYKEKYKASMRDRPF